MVVQWDQPLYSDMSSVWGQTRSWQWGAEQEVDGGGTHAETTICLAWVNTQCHIDGNKHPH